ncbi:MAG TPA: CRTAC1 family protein [Bryobacteraceae bacterium]|nr:CRTAC1 family protein [Bryobacteraceae bacterium]
MTRRQLLSLSALALPAARRARAQMHAVVPQGIKPLTAAKFSGLPYNTKFVDVAAAAGLTKPIIFGVTDHADYIVESMGCGVAFLDYDNDGWQDILLLTGQHYGQPSPEGAVIRLYKNNRDGTFREVTEKSGLGQHVWASGVTVADYDNDGFEDIFITCWGQNILLHNEGNGTFKDVTAKAGLIQPHSRFGTGCTWVDYDRDGHLDLFVSNYLVFDTTKIPARGKDAGCAYSGIPVECGPTGIQGETCILYRNNGDGTFTDVSEKAGISTVKPRYCLTAAAADFDDDGWPDIYVACDATYSLLFRNNKDGTFTERGLESGVALNEDGRTQEGMGIGIGDYDCDGSLDIFKTHFSSDTNVLYRNLGKGVFRDTTIRAGLGVETRFVGWGAAIEDFDNDGLPDLLYTTGMIFPELDGKISDAPFKTPTVIFRNLGGGKFEELIEHAGPALKEVHSSRGLAVGDFDNDGDLDILIMNMNEPPSLLRNDIDRKNHWIKVQLIGSRSNRSAIGATVICSYGDKKQAKAVMAQSSYLSANDKRLHFGLGSETKASVEIRWPSGKSETLADIVPDRLVVIQEGAGIVRTGVFGK